MNVKPKKQPKWYQFRKRLCKGLVNLARWVEPRSEEVSAFHMQQMMDMMITGCSITRIDPATHLWEIPPEEKHTVN